MCRKPLLPGTYPMSSSLARNFVFSFCLVIPGRYLWSMMAKLGKKNNARRFRKQYISPVGTFPQQILTLCNVTCKYTRISCLVLSCLVLYKLQEFVSRWDRKVLHGSGFRNLSEFLKKRQDSHHLVMFTWSTFVENDATTKEESHIKGSRERSPEPVYEKPRHVLNFEQ